MSLEDLQNDPNKKEKLLASLEVVKQLISPLSLSLRGSGVEVLLGNEEIEVSDIDIQIVLNNEQDHEILEGVVEKIKNSGYNIQKEHQAKYIVTKGGECFDMHIVQKEGDFYIEHSQQGDFFFPQEAYKYEDTIRYLSPEILLLMSKGSKNNNAKNIQRIARLKTLCSEEITEILGKKFKFIKNKNI